MQKFAVNAHIDNISKKAGLKLNALFGITPYLDLNMKNIYR